MGNWVSKGPGNRKCHGAAPEIVRDLAERYKRRECGGGGGERELSPVGRVHVGKSRMKDKKGKQKLAFVYKRPENERRKPNGPGPGPESNRNGEADGGFNPQAHGFDNQSELGKDGVHIPGLGNRRISRPPSGASGGSRQRGNEISSNVASHAITRFNSSRSGASTRHGVSPAGSEASSTWRSDRRGGSSNGGSQRRGRGGHGGSNVGRLPFIRENPSNAGGVTL
ncbi:hypothetical protein MMC21_002796 [Puttea exsequens]|nr:hypothetical protein [Puttea exsequens]